MKVDEHIQLLENERERPDLSLTTDQVIEESLDAIEDDLWYLDSPEGFKQHTQDFLRELYSEKHPVDEESICDCAHPFCAPKQGDLPSRVREADDFGKELDRYRMSHNNPEWISDCRREWRERRRRVKKALRLARMAARNDNMEVLEPVVGKKIIEEFETVENEDEDIPEPPTPESENDGDTE